MTWPEGVLEPVILFGIGVLLFCAVVGTLGAVIDSVLKREG